MPKRGITILEDVPGPGPEIKQGDRIRLVYDLQLNRGDFLSVDQAVDWTVGDRRSFVAGFIYGLEGMRAGGRRRFKASPHLCYRDQEVGGVPKNAVLICAIKSVEILAEGWMQDGPARNSDPVLEGE